MRRESKNKVKNPFEVKDCVLIAIGTGINAQNLRELRDRLTTVHAGCIYYHFWGGLLVPRFEEPEYNNDFAAWARHGLHDHILAERLAVIDPRDFPDLEELRNHLIEIIEERLYEADMVPWAKRDQQFHFKRSQTVVFDTNKRIADPSKLPNVLPTLSVGSIFYHFIDARRRLPQGLDDFSLWLEAYGTRYARLVREIADIDPYFTTLHEIRERMCELSGHYCTSEEA